MAHRQTGLRLVRERKLDELLAGAGTIRVLEASGVVVKDGHYLVVFDNIRRIARIGSTLEPGSSEHAWVGRLREGEGYEDIAYNASRHSLNALIEAKNILMAPTKRSSRNTTRNIDSKGEAGWTCRSRNETAASKGCARSD